MELKKASLLAGHLRERMGALVLPEPNVACPHGHITCTLQQGASQGMRCRVCGATLERVDERWLMGDRRKGIQPVLPWRLRLEYKVAELQLPAHNEVDEEAVGQFITTLPLPISLELFGSGDRRVMLVRGQESNLRHLAAKIQAHWPSAMLRILDEDPVNPGAIASNGSARIDFAFRLAKEGYLPIRTWTSFLQGDPMHNLLAATQGLLGDEKAWLQVLLVRKSVPTWLSKVQQRLKMEAQRGFMVAIVHPARLDRVLDLVRLYELVDSGGIEPVSRANQAAAFARISRSSCSCLPSGRVAGERVLGVQRSSARRGDDPRPDRPA